MKLSTLRQLIKETLENDATSMPQENIEETPKFEGVNQIKEFYVVSKPTNENRESAVRKANVFDEILMNETHGVYMSQAEASREAKRLTSEYQTQLQELEKTMEEEDSKSMKLRDMIRKMKGI